jgi:hypothetical protein
LEVLLEEEVVVVVVVEEEEEELLPPPLQALVRAREHVLVEEQAAVWTSTVAQAVEVANMFQHQSQTHPRWTRNKPVA